MNGTFSSMAGRRRISPAAFTLVELLVVIAIIGTLIALLLPAVQSAREAARRSHCLNNLKQIGLAVQCYHDVHGHYPSGRRSRTQYGVSWAFRLLPHMEQTALHEAFAETERVDAPENATAMRTPVATFFCPSRRSPVANRNFDDNDAPTKVPAVAAGGDYASNAGLSYHMGTVPETPVDEDNPGRFIGPIFTLSRVKDRQVTDGLSQTFAVGERHIPPAPDNTTTGLEHRVQGDTAFFSADTPETIFGGTENGLATDFYDANNGKFGSHHSQITLFAFLDGHVQSIDQSVQDVTLQRLSTIADGELIDF